MLPRLQITYLQNWWKVLSLESFYLHEKRAYIDLREVFHHLPPTVATKFPFVNLGASFASTFSQNVTKSWSLRRLCCSSTTNNDYHHWPSWTILLIPKSARKKVFLKMSYPLCHLIYFHIINSKKGIWILFQLFANLSPHIMHSSH